jgi:predicted heme/steroid binding protein/uncharacterized membrane protein
MKVFSQHELLRENGENGSRMLVAVDGKVYDISASKKWLHGKHMNRHRAGMDLTTDIRSAPHGLDVLERFELAGTLEQVSVAPPAGLRGRVEALLNAYPFFRRHPHPAAVHFPLGLLLTMPLLQIAALVAQSPCTEWAACCCLGIGLVFMPPVMVSGYFTWWINYEAKGSPTIWKKQLFAWIALALAVLTLVLRASYVQDPLRLGDPLVLLYVLFSFGLAGVIGIVGFLGGTLTFPYDKH